jgi:hypothetical protein
MADELRVSRVGTRPEQLDLEDALAAPSNAAEDDPIKRYDEEMKRTAPQRQMWADARPGRHARHEGTPS